MTNIYDALQKPKQGSNKKSTSTVRGASQSYFGGMPLGKFSSQLAPLFILVQHLADQRQSGVVLHIASLNPGDGASTIAREFAYLAASKGRRRTLLLDGNGADPAISMAFGCPQTTGLLARSASQAPIDDLLRQIPNLPLYVGSLGGDDVDVAADPGRISDAYESFRKKYELTVIDCPAISTGGYTNLSPHAADGIVLVIRAGTDKPVVLQNAKDLIEQAGGKVIGAVLNRQKFHIPKFLYNLL